MCASFVAMSISPKQEIPTTVSRRIPILKTCPRIGFAPSAVPVRRTLPRKSVTEIPIFDPFGKKNCLNVIKIAESTPKECGSAFLSFVYCILRYFPGVMP